MDLLPVLLGTNALEECSDDPLGVVFGGLVEIGSSFRKELVSGLCLIPNGDAAFLDVFYPPRRESTQVEKSQGIEGSVRDSVGFEIERSAEVLPVLGILKTGHFENGMDGQRRGSHPCRF